MPSETCDAITCQFLAALDQPSIHPVDSILRRCPRLSFLTVMCPDASTPMFEKQHDRLIYLQLGCPFLTVTPVRTYTFVARYLNTKPFPLTLFETFLLDSGVRRSAERQIAQTKGIGR
jgi:hypothetical protein